MSQYRISTRHTYKRTKLTALLGGRFISSSWSRSSLELLMYDRCALAIGWSLTSHHVARAFSRLPEYDTTGRWEMGSFDGLFEKLRRPVPPN